MGLFDRVFQSKREHLFDLSLSIILKKDLCLITDEGHDFGDGDPGNDTGVKKDDPVDFSSIESLLNPDSESVRQQV